MSEAAIKALAEEHQGLLGDAPQGEFIPAFPGQLSEVGLTLPPNMPIGEWLDIGPRLCGIGDWVKWALGDWLKYGEHTYGEKYTQALEVTGYDYGTLRTLHWMAGAIEEERRQRSIPHSWHEPVARLEPEQQTEMLQEAVSARISEERFSRDDFRKLVRDRYPGKGVKADHQQIHSSDSVEWGTPEEMLSLVREVMGGIDLDPASSEFFNQVVQAEHYYSEEDDGLSQDWKGRVFLNPPYGREGNESRAGIWVEKLVGEYRVGEALGVSQAILEVNANTGQAWFQPLWDFPICFVDHRLYHYNASGAQKQPTNATVYVYLGPDPEKFRDVFSRVGAVVRRWKLAGDDA